eukprot:scaffold59889_cov63-Phaeocystis_antarctica.AAC.2
MLMLRMPRAGLRSVTRRLSQRSTRSKSVVSFSMTPPPCMPRERRSAVRIEKGRGGVECGQVGMRASAAMGSGGMRRRTFASMSCTAMSSSSSSSCQDSGVTSMPRFARQASAMACLSSNGLEAADMGSVSWNGCPPCSSTLSIHFFFVFFAPAPLSAPLLLVKPVSSASPSARSSSSSHWAYFFSLTGRALLPIRALSACSAAGFRFR